MKNTWEIEDILDLDFFNRLDSESEENREVELHRRDREFYLRASEKASASPIAEQACLKIWLRERRAAELEEKNGFLPGRTIQESHSLFRLIFLITGLLCGAGLAFSYFVYTGKTPLNVFLFFTIFIAPQLLLVLLIFFQVLFTPLLPRNRTFGHTFFSLFKKLFLIAKKNLLHNLAPEKNKIVAGLLSWEQGSLLLWPFFLVTQLFGIGFNIGVLFITIVKIITTDLAFGWQSTLQLGTEKLYALVTAMATPWSWIAPSHLSHPSLSEIEGSRIVLKDGIYHLLTEDLVSWWPFLLLSLLFYGLLPRLVLYLCGSYMQKRSFGRHLQSGRYKRIVKRMKTPLVTTQAPPQQTNEQGVTETGDNDPVRPQRHNAAMTPVLILIPDEMQAGCTTEALTAALSSYGYQVQQCHSVFHSYSADIAALDMIGKMTWQQEKGILIVFEAWMPPLKEHLLFLHSLRSIMPEEIFLDILLLGRPSQQTVFTPVQQSDRRIWRRKIHELHLDITFIEPIQST